MSDTPKRTCVCGKPVAPQYMGFAGHCSRNCLLDHLGETDSEVGD